ncbi:MAG: hypothetical protein O7A98_08725, partial [Acidobacteria bacterium]|nr:hypothetical protein [Acidobacteriota bacterium]
MLSMNRLGTPAAGILAGPLLALALITIPVSPAMAAIACFSDSCATSCSPGAPVAISTLVAAASFPSGADTPIAFVDPG